MPKKSMVKGVSKFIFWVRPFIDLDYLIGIETLFFNYKFFQKRLLLFLKNVGRKIREIFFSPSFQHTQKWVGFNDQLNRFRLTETLSASIMKLGGPRKGACSCCCFCHGFLTQILFRGKEKLFEVKKIIFEIDKTCSKVRSCFPIPWHSRKGRKKGRIRRIRRRLEIWQLTVSPNYVCFFC